MSVGPIPVEGIKQATPAVHSLTTTVQPTLTEYWTAADLVYADDREGKGPDLAPPASSGLTLLLDSGTANPKWLADGFFAQAFQDTSGNVVIAFEGSLPFEGSVYGIASTYAFAQVLAGQTPRAFADALAFTADVEKYLVAHSLASNPVYLTGHSLGGAEAEYVAANDGLSGVTFGAPGTLHPVYPSIGAGQTFTNYVDYGDPLGNFGSHFGSVQEVGPVSDAAATASLEKTLGSVLGAAVAALKFHPLNHYAADLGISTSLVASNSSIGHFHPMTG
jgi:hypothetical protein